ncbi:MAG TPA: ATP synthase F0 subunit B [Pyrinomonadaceae bacterium]|nr:ATP synthase F0 subunit B [Pyrinomonadaceae bacterium]
MFLINATLLLVLQAGDAPWWNYPGLELWKFTNLFIFIAAGIYLHHRFGKPIKSGLQARRESIKRELKQAQAERDAALAKLAEIEARFSTLDQELGKVRDRNASELAAETQRMKSATDQEVERMRDQARREIENTGKAVRQDLKAFAAAESVRLAEQVLQSEIGPEQQARLSDRSVAELGRPSH